MSKHYAVIRLAVEPQEIKGPQGNLQTGAFYGWMTDYRMAMRALDHWRKHYPEQYVVLVKDQQKGNPRRPRPLQVERSRTLHIG